MTPSLPRSSRVGVEPAAGRRHAVAGPDDVDDDEADRERERADDLEVEDREAADLADRLHARASTATPTTTVQKISGAIVIVISLMKPVTERFELDGDSRARATPSDDARPRSRRARGSTASGGTARPSAGDLTRENLAARCAVNFGARAKFRSHLADSGIPCRSSISGAPVGCGSPAVHHRGGRLPRARHASIARSPRSTPPPAATSTPSSSRGMPWEWSAALIRARRGARARACCRSCSTRAWSSGSTGSARRRSTWSSTGRISTSSRARRAPASRSCCRSAPRRDDELAEFVATARDNGDGGIALVQIGDRCRSRGSRRAAPPRARSAGSRIARAARAIRAPRSRAARASSRSGFGARSRSRAHRAARARAARARVRDRVGVAGAARPAVDDELAPR